MQSVHEAQVREHEDELGSLRTQLQTTLNEMASMRQKVLEASERDMVRLSLAIAETVVGRELTTDPALVASWVRAGIDHLIEEDHIEIAVASDVAEAIPEEAWSDGIGNSVQPIVDPSLAPGACEVRGEYSRVDASAVARLAAVADAMGASDKDD